MKRLVSRLVVLAGLAIGFTNASAERPAMAAEMSSPTTTVHQSTIAGVETLQAVTHLTSADGPVTVLERASMDRHGVLVHAETLVSFAHGTSRIRAVLDRPTGTLSIARDGVSRDFHFTGDEPWVLAPPKDHDGVRLSTAVAGWITLRGAASAAAVRVIDLDSGTSYLTTRSEVASETEEGPAAFAADDVAVSDGRFITSFASGGRTFVRRPSSDKVWRFVPEQCGAACALPAHSGGRAS
jgi:hypothetical protein